MNCIIIEDEIPAQELLISYIEKVPELKLQGVFNSALKANPILQDHSISIIFLDINLPTISGLNYLKTLKNSPAIIMTTAYSDYAVECFEYDEIIDYLVKPFNFERFLKSINRLETKQQNETQTLKYQSIDSVKKEANFIFINVDKTLHKIIISDIVFLQSDRNYVTVVTKKIKLSFIDSLKKWSVHLNQPNFIQVHRSYIINVNYIEKLTGNIVYIENQKLPIGSKFKANLMNKIKPIN